MKQFATVLFMALALSAQAADNHAAADAAKAEHETKRICVDVKKDGKEVIDPKTKKPKQTCKEVKQHKKLDVEKK